MQTYIPPYIPPIYTYKKKYTLENKKNFVQDRGGVGCGERSCLMNLMKY